jgi:hypothetical protein
VAVEADFLVVTRENFQFQAQKTKTLYILADLYLFFKFWNEPFEFELDPTTESHGKGIAFQKVVLQKSLPISQIDFPFLLLLRQI